MAVQSIIDPIFSPIFGWMFQIPPILAILILSFILAMISTLLQKYMTDQAKMRRLKDDIKKQQAEYKKVAKEDPQKALKMQQKMIPLQMDLTKSSLKPILITFIPFLLIVVWLNAHFAFHQILPNQTFNVSATFTDGVSGTATLYAPTMVLVSEKTQEVTNQHAVWQVVGKEGEHDLFVEFQGANVTRKVLITNDRSYDAPVHPFPGSVTSVDVSNVKLLPISGFHIFSWYPGWIAYYILFSIPLSLLLKKFLNVA